MTSLSMLRSAPLVHTDRSQYSRLVILLWKAHEFKTASSVLITNWMPRSSTSSRLPFVINTWTWRWIPITTSWPIWNTHCNFQDFILSRIESSHFAVNPNHGAWVEIKWRLRWHSKWAELRVLKIILWETETPKERQSIIAFVMFEAYNLTQDSSKNHYEQVQKRTEIPHHQLVTGPLLIDIDHQLSLPPNTKRRSVHHSSELVTACNMRYKRLFASASVSSFVVVSFWHNRFEQPVVSSSCWNHLLNKVRHCIDVYLRTSWLINQYVLFSLSTSYAEYNKGT